MIMNLDRSVSPEVKPINRVDIPLPEKCELSNGIPVFSFDLTELDLIRIEIVFKSGSAHEHSTLGADFTAKMLREGTVARSGKEIADYIDYHGSFIEQTISKDITTFTLFTLTKFVHQTIEVLAEIIASPIFPENELETLKKNELQKFQVNMHKNSIACKHEFGKLLYPKSHPYFSDIHANDFDVNREQLIEHHKQFLNLSDATIFIAGKVTKDIIKTIDSVIGKVKNRRSKNLEINRIEQAIGTKVLLPKNDAVQSAIRIGRLLPFKKSSDDFIPFQVLNTLLGGYFSSRLMANIREDKGFTYGIGSGLLANLSSTIFLIATEVNVNSTGETIKEISYEMDRLKTEKVSNSELNRVKKFMIGSFLRSSDGPFNVSDKYKSSYFHGLDNEFNSLYLSKIQDVSSENIRDLAIKYLNDKDMIEVVVGNR
jgi:zinc protease